MCAYEGWRGMETLSLDPCLRKPMFVPPDPKVNRIKLDWQDFVKLDWFKTWQTRIGDEETNSIIMKVIR